MADLSFLQASLIKLKGGSGSGNFGHSGRPGEVGGSSSSGESSPHVRALRNLAARVPVLRGELDPRANADKLVNQAKVSRYGYSSLNPASLQDWQAEVNKQFEELKAQPLIHGASIPLLQEIDKNGLKSNRLVNGVAQTKYNKLMETVTKLQVLRDKGILSSTQYHKYIADMTQVKQQLELQAAAGSTYEKDRNAGLDQFVFMSHGSANPYGDVKVVIDNSVLESPKTFATPKDIAQMYTDFDPPHAYADKTQEEYRKSVVNDGGYYEAAAAERVRSHADEHGSFEVKSADVIPPDKILGYVAPVNAELPKLNHPVITYSPKVYGNVDIGADFTVLDFPNGTKLNEWNLRREIYKLMQSGEYKKYLGRGAARKAAYDAGKRYHFGRPTSDTVEEDPKNAFLDVALIKLKGGAGSGNFGHEGRPGEVGGSSVGGGRSRAALAKLKELRPEAIKKIDEIAQHTKIGDTWEQLDLGQQRDAEERFTQFSKGDIQSIIYGNLHHMSDKEVVGLKTNRLALHAAESETRGMSEKFDIDSKKLVTLRAGLSSKTDLSTFDFSSLLRNPDVLSDEEKVAFNKQLQKAAGAEKLSADQYISGQSEDYFSTVRSNLEVDLTYDVLESKWNAKTDEEKMKYYSGSSTELLRSTVVARAAELNPMSKDWLAKSNDNLWGTWKSASQSPDALIIQNAAMHTFGVNPPYKWADRVEDFDKEYGPLYGHSAPDVIKEKSALLKAQWETTQWLLKDKPVPDYLYRAVYVDKSNFESTISEAEAGLDMTDHYAQALAERRLEGTKLDNLQLMRNPMNSFTSDLSVANTWDGVGEIPKGAVRVVIRAKIPKEAILSTPEFGDNAYNESEYVVLGTPWEWEAFYDKAPSA